MEEVKIEETVPVSTPVLVREGRRLVTIRKINAINPIPNADAIEVATVDGWDVVIKKGEFSVGDFCVFFEIDSFLPEADPRFNFLSSSSNKIDEKGVERIRLRTIRLRKQLSQGLVLPLKLFRNDLLAIAENETTIEFEEQHWDLMQPILVSHLEEERFGIEQYLNVTKYERPEERNGGAGKGAKAAGNFPWYIPKTDAERLENCYNKLNNNYADVLFRPTLKMDGSSTTIAFVHQEEYFVDKIDDVRMEWSEEAQELVVAETIPYPFKDENGMVIVCSRNLALKYDPESYFWKGVHNAQIHVNLREYCEQYNRQLAIQAETIGPGVNGNWDKQEDYSLYAFHIWDIDKQEYLDDAEFYEVCAALQINVAKPFPVEAVFQKYKTLQEFKDASDIPSIVNPIAEGIVYKSVEKVNGQRLMFKVINNKYLLAEK